MNNVHRCLLLVLFFLLPLIFSSNISANDSPPHRVQPSFDCGNASTDVEYRVCESGTLSGLDVWLSYVYHLALQKGDAKKIREKQRAWMKKRNKCMNMSSEYGYRSDGLVDCYAERINELLEENDIVKDDGFYASLANKMGFYEPKNSNKAEKFLYHNNLSSLLEGYFDGHCGYIEGYILYYKSPLLVMSYNGSTVCGGTSHAVSGKAYYCETGDGFVRGNIWSCKPQAMLDEEFLMKYYMENSFSDFAKSNPVDDNETNIIIQYLYSVPIHSLSEPDRRAENSRVFNEKNISYLERNVDFVLSVFHGYEKEFMEILDGMQCTYDSITKKSDWENVFRYNIPADWQGEYVYGRKFDGCDEYDIRIKDQRYTRKELYVNLWRRLYFSGGFDKAHRFLPVLRSRIEGNL